MGILGNAPAGRGNGYKFTSKSQSEKGIMAMVLGGIALVSFFVSNMDSFSLKGEVAMRLGAAGFLSFIFGLAGLVLGIMAVREKDVFKTIPVCGLCLSLLGLICWLLIALLGTGVIGI